MPPAALAQVFAISQALPLRPTSKFRPAVGRTPHTQTQRSHSAISPEAKHTWIVYFDLRRLVTVCAPSYFHGRPHKGFSGCSSGGTAILTSREQASQFSQIVIRRSGRCTRLTRLAWALTRYYCPFHHIYKGRKLLWPHNCPRTSCTQTPAIHVLRRRVASGGDEFKFRMSRGRSFCRWSRRRCS
ncbi:hypothetical protein B0H11DRAFT_2115653 [Mycena galericulata]|nr:hypothetical protein B0H11DRAFT_2115653 [Mycena galericulata]